MIRRLCVPSPVKSGGSAGAALGVGLGGALRPGWARGHRRRRRRARLLRRAAAGEGGPCQHSDGERHAFHRGLPGRAGEDRHPGQEWEQLQALDQPRKPGQPRRYARDTHGGEEVDHRREAEQRGRERVVEVGAEVVVTAEASRHQQQNHRHPREEQEATEGVKLADSRLWCAGWIHRECSRQRDADCHQTKNRRAGERGDTFPESPP